MFFCKQNTAYEMRISDWSSDVCSSDLKPLDFNSFPTILLISTMLRLALNLASTRLILAEGHNGTDAAGQVIEAFGSFVMGGNFVIGVIIFGITVIVNFVEIGRA